MAQPVSIEQANDDEPQFERGDSRVSVMLAAQVQSGTSAIPVTIRSISSLSATVSAVVIPPTGSIVRFARGDIAVAARVSSVSSNSFELEFHEAIDERALLVHLGPRTPGRLPPSHALFPIEHYVGRVTNYTEKERLPISKH